MLSCNYPSKFSICLCFNSTSCSNDPCIFNICISYSLMSSLKFSISSSNITVSSLNFYSYSSIMLLYAFSLLSFSSSSLFSRVSLSTSNIFFKCCKISSLLLYCSLISFWAFSLMLSMFSSNSLILFWYFFSMSD